MNKFLDYTIAAAGLLLGAVLIAMGADALRRIAMESSASDPAAEADTAAEGE